jgi:hypothetical protein
MSLPHPVLGVSDDVEGEYRVNFTVQLSKEEIILRTEHLLSNPTLEQMLRDGRAAYCVEVNCMKTFFRKTFSSNETPQEIRIPSDELRDKVECEFYMATRDDIRRYAIKGANSDYAGSEFYVTKGDVLASGGRTFFIAEKDWEAYRAVSSFMVVVEDEEREEGPIKIDLSSDKIVIYMSGNDHKRYHRVRKSENCEAIFHSSLVLPVLIYALSQMKEGSDSYSGRKWYDMLEYRRNTDNDLKRYNWDDPTMMPEIAQKILDDPLNRTLSSVEAIFNNF